MIVYSTTITYKVWLRLLTQIIFSYSSDIIESALSGIWEMGEAFLSFYIIWYHFALYPKPYFPSESSMHTITLIQTLELSRSPVITQGHPESPRSNFRRSWFSNLGSIFNLSLLCHIAPHTLRFWQFNIELFQRGHCSANYSFIEHTVSSHFFSQLKVTSCIQKPSFFTCL